MKTAPEESSSPHSKSSSSLSLIDCDVHQYWNSPQDIIKYLPKAFHERGINLPNDLGLINPHGVLRRDAVPASGGLPGSCPLTMREQLLDAYAVDYAILLGGNILSVCVSPDTYYATSLASAYNDWLVEEWLPEDPRFLGAIAIAPQDAQSAANEIRRLGSNQRLVQVLMASATPTPLGRPQYWPIYEAACELDLPVAIHPGAEGKGIANSYSAGYPSTYFEWHTGIPQNFMGQVTSLICEGVFEQFPTLRFVCVEGGLSWVPHLMWRLDKNWKSLRLQTPWLKKRPSEYIVECMRFTTQPIDEPDNPDHLLQIFEMMQAEKTVIFSSDYPHWDFDSPTKAFPPLPEKLAKRIFYQNAQELYRLDMSSASQTEN